MEPRPTNKPNRGQTGGAPDSSFPASNNPIYSGGDSASWSTSAWTSSTPGPAPKPNPNPPEQLTARAADWHGQPGAYAPQNDIGYSPGPSLAPIDQRRASGWLGPLVAIAVLALIIAGVAIAFTKIRGGDSNPPTQTAQLGAPAKTHTAAAQVQVTPTAPPASATAPAATKEPTKTPTAKPQATDTPAASSGGGSTSAGALSTAPAKTLLPTLAEVGNNYTVTEDSSRTSDEVAASFSDPAGAAAHLKSWSWKENAYRTFVIPADKVSGTNETDYISVSVHRFGRVSGSKAAFTYFADEVVSVQGLSDVTVETIGDQTRELTGSSNGANLAVLYIRSGYYLIRIGASSQTGDPSADVLALAKKIVKP